MAAPIVRNENDLNIRIPEEEEESDTALLSTSVSSGYPTVEGGPSSTTLSEMGANDFSWSSGLPLTPREMDDDTIDEYFILAEHIQRKGISDRVRRRLSTSLADQECTNENRDCHVCLVPITSSCIITRLPCKHYYHEHCIGRWLEANRSCPTCRFILKDE